VTVKPFVSPLHTACLLLVLPFLMGYRWPHLNVIFLAVYIRLCSFSYVLL
jgi:hypothetical protein